jgi:cell division inhibitor SepF
MMSTFFKKAMSFLGLAEDDSGEYEADNYGYQYESLDVSAEEPYQESMRSRPRFNLRNISERGEIPGRYADNSRNTRNTRNSRKLLSLDMARDSKKLRVSVTEPHEFEEVQMIGDDLKMNIPVIINLQDTNADLSKRIIDFCSGLTYALEGSIKKVADRVFLITPKDAVVTSNEKEFLKERGLYNQL